MAFEDEMIELFGGSMGSRILHDRTYKEALSIKDARVRRKLKENEEFEKQQEDQMKSQEAAMRNRK
mgnify:CR=1 FL=1